MPTTLFAWVKRHALLSYVILAYAVSWLLVLPLVTDGLGITRWHVPAVWHALGALGPIVAAFVVAGVVSGRAGVRGLLASMGRWRVSAWWYLAALSPVLLLLVSILAVRLVGAPWPDFSQLAAILSDPAWTFGALFAAAVYGLGEEPGWRGFALPLLQRRHNALVSASIVAGIWALWHTPFFAYRYQLGALELVFFVIGLFAGSIVLASLYNGAGGSTLLVMVWHVVWNIVNVLAAALAPTVVALLTVEVILAAIVIVWVWKPATLAPSRKAARQPIPATRPTQRGAYASDGGQQGSHDIASV
ncbi:MAG TPA: CPBP family intramembrane glutamic endopeptidase [Ktedonobacterales bacterium]